MQNDSPLILDFISMSGLLLSVYSLHLDYLVWGVRPFQIQKSALAVTEAVSVRNDANQAMVATETNWISFKGL